MKSNIKILIVQDASQKTCIPKCLRSCVTILMKTSTTKDTKRMLLLV